MSQAGEDYARNIASLAAEKKARDIIILDMHKVSLIADYFIICSANTKRQVQAIADFIRDSLKEDESLPAKVEGYQDGRWVLLDCGDIIVHILQDEERIFYNLERLWGEATQLEFEQDADLKTE